MMIIYIWDWKCDSDNNLKYFFIYKYVKIIFFNFLKLFLISTYQNDMKT
jgi:hypothetical protein